MVLCLIALPIFAVLGIFSLHYRKLAKESLDCLFKTVTLRKCRSGLDDRIKSQVSGKLLKRSPRAAKVFYNHYKIITFLILVLFIWSAYESSIGVYNYVQYGNCNGPESTGFCMLDPTGQNSGLSEVDTAQEQEIIIPTKSEEDPMRGNPNAEFTVIEYGCFVCPYTKKAEPIVQEVLEHYEGKVNFQFKVFPIPRHKLSFETALGASCAEEQGKYWEYHDALFENQENITLEKMSQIAETMDMNMTKFEDCMENETYKDEIAGDTLEATQAAVRGTPTFFIGDKRIVGPKPLRTFKTLINKEMEK